MTTILQNFYKETILQACTDVATTIYVSTKPTPTSGWLVISPNNASLREIVQYTATGTDGTGDYITVSNRGVGGTSARAHSVGEPIRMNITAEHWADIPVSINSITTSAALASQITDETGSGALVFGTSPTLTTPVLTTPSISSPSFTTAVNFGAKTASFTETDNGNSSTADTIDWTTSNKQKSTLTGNCTFTFTAPASPCNLILKLVQDATGSRTVTWPAAVKWASATAPTLTTTANKIDIISFYYDGTNYYGSAILNFTA